MRVHVFCLFLLLLHFLLPFLLFPSLTAKLHHQRFPEPSVSMNQLQGILGSFTICQRKTNIQNKSRSLWSKVKRTASWPTWLQRRNHSPGRVMKAWPFILPVSSRYRTGGPFSCSNLENSATSWATDACALRFFTHNTYSETKQTNRSSISTRKCLVEMVM